MDVGINIGIKGKEKKRPMNKSNVVQSLSSVYTYTTSCAGCCRFYFRLRPNKVRLLRAGSIPPTQLEIALPAKVVKLVTASE